MPNNHELPRERRSRTHVRLIDQLVEAIDNERCQPFASCLPSLRQLRARVLEGASHDEFQAFMLRHPDLAKYGLRVSIERGIAFLESELEYFNHARETRELTDEENRYGKENVMPLLKELANLAKEAPPDARRERN